MTLGLTIMLIGILTVFAIMFLIVYIIQGLIALVNRIAPEEPAPAKTRLRNAIAADALTMNIISDAVKQITGGRGKVKTVEKL
jgi:oxaloacetate decarboxylase gamma subunit